MDKFIRWWNQKGTCCGEKRYVTLGKAVLASLLPLACVLTYCAAQGRSLGEVYLPASQWNDELFYFKQVEGIVNYGFPQGYFGFNESHALKLSFAAWSPVLVFPWILWGLLFGWNLMSPVWCNLLLLSLCCFVYVCLVRPSWKQLGILAFLFCLYTPFVRYLLSGMPEVICFCMVIGFYSLAVSYVRAERVWKLALLFGMSGVMTLMRPYMLMFMLLPAFFWIRREKCGGWKGLLGSAAVMGVVLGLYAWVKHYLGAEYFTPLFFTDWITSFPERGFFGGIGYTVSRLYYMGKAFLGHLLQGMRTGLASGAIFGSYLVCTGILAIHCARDWMAYRRRKKDGQSGGKDLLAIEIHLAFCFVAMLFALLLMYKLTEGSKHLLTFLAAAVFVVPLMDTRFYKKAVLLGAAFAWFFSYKAVDPYDYQVPFVEEAREASLEKWREALRGELVLEREHVPGYENVVIWTFEDRVEGENVMTSWQLLYALPEGFGISCCMRDYVAENFEGLRSRYLACPTGGEIQGMCREAGYSLVYGDGELVLYRLR